MFINRDNAGKQLAEKLLYYERKSPLVVALPRGGVVVGFPIAQALHAPLEVVVVRKLGSPHNPELGIGAIAEDGVEYIDTDMFDIYNVSQTDLHSIEEQERRELARRKQLYRNGKKLPLLTNKTVILVDDGLATGVTARAALLALKKHHPKQIIFAIPVCARETALATRPLVHSIICLQSPEHLEAIGHYYKDFPQVSDEEVMRLLEKVNEDNSIIKEREEGDFGHKIVW